MASRAVKDRQHCCSAVSLRLLVGGLSGLVVVMVVAVVVVVVVACTVLVL